MKSSSSSVFVLTNRILRDLRRSKKQRKDGFNVSPLFRRDFQVAGRSDGQGSSSYHGIGSMINCYEGWMKAAGFKRTGGELQGNNAAQAAGGLVG